MIVFEYLYGMMDVFGPEMDKYANGERRHVDNEDDDAVSNSIVAVSNLIKPLIKPYSAYSHDQLILYN